MNRRTGFTLVEILFAMGIIMMLSGVAAFVVAPSIKEAGTKRVCASNLKQIGTAFRLYMADNDGGITYWKSREMNPYFKTSRVQLFCPKATSVNKSGNPVGSYRDLVLQHAAFLNTPGLTVSRKLTNGMVAPEFDVEHDALIKCLVHGDNGYVEPPFSGLLMSTEVNIRARIQTLCSDGHIAMAHPHPCWEVPYYQNDYIYKAHPELLGVCDGTMEK